MRYRCHSTKYHHPLHTEALPPEIGSRIKGCLLIKLFSEQQLGNGSELETLISFSPKNILPAFPNTPGSAPAKTSKASQPLAYAAEGLDKSLHLLSWNDRKNCIHEDLRGENAI